jgi:hypothetical protein
VNGAPECEAWAGQLPHLAHAVILVHCECAVCHKVQPSALPFTAMAAAAATAAANRHCALWLRCRAAAAFPFGIGGFWLTVVCFISVVLSALFWIVHLSIPAAL